MEDKSIRDIFSEFNPTLPGDSQFMSRLQKRLDAVEILREHNLEMRKKHRIAVAIAAIVGFISGMIFSMFLPAIGEALAHLQATLPTDAAASLTSAVNLPSASTVAFLIDNYLPIALTMIAAASTFISINTFDLTLYLLRRRP